MHEIDLRELDLNLLVVLDVLLQERSVSRAAQRIGRTQSATSHALARLRSQLQDPLLVRVGDSMVPTPRAERLAVDLRRVLRSLSRVLEGDVDFVPNRTERIFALGGPDFLCAQLPRIVGRLRESAPNARLELSGPTTSMMTALVDGHLDAVVSPPPNRLPHGVANEPLARLTWTVFARAGHPAIGGWGLAAWRRYPHIQIRTAGARGPVDEAAKARGFERKIGAWLPNFFPAAALVAETDMLLTAPKAVLGDLGQRLGLVQLKCPIKLPPIPLHLHRAQHLSRDPAVSFFCDVLRGALGLKGR